MTCDVILLLNRQMKMDRKLTGCYITLFKPQLWILAYSPFDGFHHSKHLKLRHSSILSTRLALIVITPKPSWCWLVGYFHPVWYQSRTNLSFWVKHSGCFLAVYPECKLTINMTESSGPILEDRAHHQITSHQSFVYRRLSGCVGLSY